MKKYFVYSNCDRMNDALRLITDDRNELERFIENSEIPYMESGVIDVNDTVVNEDDMWSIVFNEGGWEEVSEDDQIYKVDVTTYANGTEEYAINHYAEDAYKGILEDTVYMDGSRDYTDWCKFVGTMDECKKYVKAREIIRDKNLVFSADCHEQFCQQLFDYAMMNAISEEEMNTIFDVIFDIESEWM